MMIPSESDIEKAGCKYATERGLETRKLAWLGRRDAPDRVFWGDDIPIFLIEVKAPGKTLRPGQRREIDAIRRSGSRVYVCDSLACMGDKIDAEIRRSLAVTG